MNIGKISGAGWRLLAALLCLVFWFLVLSLF